MTAASTRTKPAAGRFQAAGIGTKIGFGDSDQVGHDIERGGSGHSPLLPPFHGAPGNPARIGKLLRGKPELCAHRLDAGRVVHDVPGIVQDDRNAVGTGSVLRGDSHGSALGIVAGDFDLAALGDREHGRFLRLAIISERAEHGLAAAAVGHAAGSAVQLADLRGAQFNGFADLAGNPEIGGRETVETVVGDGDFFGSVDRLHVHTLRNAAYKVNNYLRISAYFFACPFCARPKSPNKVYGVTCEPSAHRAMPWRERSDQELSARRYSLGGTRAVGSPISW